MGIQSASEYIDFFINLNMGTGVSLLRFLNNEKLVLKQKLENKNLDKIAIKKGIVILEGLIDEINKLGEEQILKKYRILKK